MKVFEVLFLLLMMAHSFSVFNKNEHLCIAHKRRRTASSGRSTEMIKPVLPNKQLPQLNNIGEGDSSKSGLNKFGKKSSSSFAYRIRDHVKLGAKLSETVKGKLSLGAWIVQQGGRGNIFKQVFGVSSNDGEQLLKASQCYLSTTAGPIPGLLFISTHKLAFCSERSITLPPPPSQPPTAFVPAPLHHHHLVRTPYKVQIPISKIKRAEQSENVNKPQQKYIEIVTQDDFEFWFMGFLRFEKAFTNLQKAISIYHAAQQN